MTDQPRRAASPADENAEVRFTDKRRIDPETGEVRHPTADHAAGLPGDPPTGAAGDVGDVGNSGDSGDVGDSGDSAAPSGDTVELDAARATAAERLEDLQRVQAEYVNYRRRVDRDRALAHELAVAGMVEALLPVLDEVELARQHGELADGPFASIAEKLEQTLARFGWERYGAADEPFDPRVHEALMHTESPDVTEPTVTKVLQPGHRVGDRIIRAARVAVTAPEG